MKYQEPTTIIGKARKWFKEKGLTLELERGSAYIRINEDIDVQITSSEVQARAKMYDESRGINLSTELYQENKLHN